MAELPDATLVCGKSLPLTRPHPKGMRPDWLARASTATRQKAAAREAYARTDKARAQRYAYAHTETGKEVMRKSRAEYVKRLRTTTKGRLKLQAKMGVCHAVERGEIPPVASLSCKTCGVQAEHYHHYLGYDRPHWFHITPLCHTCHHQMHYPTR